MARRDDNSLGMDVAQDLTGLLGPIGNSVGKRMYRAVAAEWQRNRSTALRAAEAAAGLTREQFEAWAEEEPRAIPLYVKVLWAAGMNGHDETLRAMGTVLGAAARATAAGQDDGFEHAELALRAMDELTPRHFRVLGAVAAGEITETEGGEANLASSMPDDVAARTGMPSEVVQQCLINLAGAGLVGTQSVYGGTAYPVTGLGRAVVHASEAAREWRSHA